MKKILIFIDSMKPAGGIERVVSNLANKWINKYDIFILVKDDAYSFYDLDSRIQIESIDKPLRLNMSNRISRMNSLAKNIVFSHRELKKIIKSIDPGVIYTTNPVNSMEICLIGKKYAKRLIVSEHGSKLGYNKVYNLIKRYVYPRAYKISVPTTLDTELYKKEGLPAVFIPHLSTFNNQTKASLENKQILTIGRLTKDKQQIALLRIWNSIVSDNKKGEWKLLFVGKGEEENALQEYININNLSDSVTIMKPIKDVSTFFMSSSIFAFTSQYEGFGMVLLEAMSFGVPCIAFNCPSGPRDIIDHDINGFLIDDNDFDLFKTKLVELMSNNELRERFSKESFEKAKKWNNISILNEWYNLFEEISN